MSAIGSLVSSLNPLSIFGQTAEKLCDAFLPKQLEFIGDLVSLTVNLKTGNYINAASDLQDFFQDLPEQLAQLKKRSDATAVTVSEAVSEQIMEPSPPPSRSTAKGPKEDTKTEDNRAEDKKATPKTTKKADKKAESKNEAKTEGKSTKQADAKADTKTDTKTDSKTQKKTENTGNNKADAKTDKAPAARGQTATADAGSADQFFQLSDTDLMNAVKTGRIPDSVKKNAAQMAALQARIHEITEMNQMITQMLNAMHQMSMAVIHNVRV